MVQNIISKIKTKIALLCSEFGDQRGSFLLEISIAISIIGLISGFFITKTITANRIMRAQVTKNNIDTVVAALASYLANNNRLPKPSKDNGGDESTDSVSIGYVPFNTLGISAKSALDGNLQPLIYIVEVSLTSNFSNIYETSSLGSAGYFCSPITAPTISISELKNPQMDIVAFVIDTKDNYPSISDGNIITVTSSKNTFWISRDMFLIKYLKNCPCKITIKDNSASTPF